MNNEIQRKITSLTLMTIMLAGGLTFAIPGVIPDVSAQSKETANLYVSTTTFGGPMIVEVIVRDSNLSDTDEPEAEPDVTFDGNDLRMVQATDGYWYAYVANNASIGVIDDVTDGTTALDGIGLDFGTYCPQDRTDDLFNDVGSEASGDVYVSATNCSDTADEQASNVLRSAKTLNTAQDIGNTDLADEDLWPFIQTFSFADDANVDVVYSGGGASQSIDLTYDADMDDFASYSLDRTSYPHGADVHLTISDNQLNIDPTDEDVWTFDTNGGNEAYYYLFNGNGEQGDGITNPTNYAVALDAASFGDNGFLFIDPNPNDAEEPVLTFMDNADQNQPDTPTLIIDTTAIVTVQETSPNSGVFSSTDDAHNSILRTTTEEDLRDLDFIIDYNDSTTNYLVEYFVGMVSIDLSSIGSDWGSGESLSVSITDQDENSNTLVDDDFSVRDSDAIPTIQIGNPFTLEGTIVSEGGVALGVPMELTNEIRALEGLVLTHDTDRGVEAAVAAITTAQEDIITQQAILDISIVPAEITLARSALETSETILETSQRIIDAAPHYTAEQQSDVDELQQKERERDELSLISPFSQILSIDGNLLPEANRANPLFVIPTTYPTVDLNTFSAVNEDGEDNDGVFQYINYDVRSLVGGTGVTITLTGDGMGSDRIITINDAEQGLELIESSTNTFVGNLAIQIETDITLDADSEYNIVLDIFTFGQEVRTDDDGERTFGDKHNDAIYRFEAEETGTNTGIYGGTLEYIMLNQINIFQDDTYSGLATISDELDIIVHEDLTDEDAVELIYLDFDAQGIATQTSAQIDAPTYSGVVSFDGDNYKVADTVTITLEDRDLNTDSDVIDIYTVIDGDFVNTDTIGIPDEELSLVLDVTFDDNLWTGGCSSDEGDAVNGLGSVISGLRETGTDTGVFTTNFQIPELYCDADDAPQSVTGLDMEVNYQDFRDASGEIIEVGDSAGIRATTGSVSFDRTVYPVPFGEPANALDADTSASQFPLHATAIGDGHLDAGILTVHVRVTDPDYDVSGSGQDVIADNTRNAEDEPIAHGPVKVMVTRGSETVVLGTAGGEDANFRGDTRITLGSATDEGITREYGPIEETAPDSGIFELDLDIEYTDGPASSLCPISDDDTVNHIQGTDNTHCILQGDILTVEYNDPTDASGDSNTITDSATFDLRNGVLQTDKPVYIIGSDMILTLIEPDFDLDNDGAETYDLDLIEWDSDAATTAMGDLGLDEAAFDPEPSALRETGDSTGIFQIVIEIPDNIDGDSLERGEEIELEYTDWGPSGANYVGHEDEDVNVTVFTSNFGATIELDQNVYSWTDKVYITIVAPDHNFDGDLIDEIGESESDPIKVATRGSELDNYKLVETGTDTGIFTGEVILTGFEHNADGDSTTGENGNDVRVTQPRGEGPTSGFLPASDDDGLTVSFEFSEDETVVSSALIRWNIGEAQWLEASYPASGTGIVRVIDPDMNLNPEAVNNFDVDVFSDSDAGGISLTVTETNEATGIFEGTVYFTIVDESSGHRLRVAEGDTVTAEYEDNTLPEPYTTADELNVTATTLIGTVVPPLERLPITNLRIVDAFGNSIDAVSIDQQVQLQADLINGQDRDQPFAYLIQVQNSDGVTVKLDWIKGATQPGQSFSAAVSWTPATTGAYTATAFGWESIDNPTALSPPVSVTINVS